MNNILGQIKATNPNSPCLDFLVKRLQSDNYRGNHISQHNYYTQQEILSILKIINDFATYQSNPYVNVRNSSEEYTELVDVIHQTTGKGTLKSVRKQFLLEMSKMGFIYRCDGNRVILNPFNPQPGVEVKYIFITHFGFCFLIEQDNTRHRFLYSQALINLIGPIYWDIYYLMQNVRSCSCISIYEYMLFVSFLNQSLPSQPNYYYSIVDILNFINEFRVMENLQNIIINLCEQYCNPNNFQGNKTTKRDWKNWQNEANITFKILGQTQLFHYDENKEILYFKSYIA